MKTKTKLASMALLSLIISTAGNAQEVHSNVGINNAKYPPGNAATFAVTSVSLTQGRWLVNGLVNVRMVPTNPGHVERLGLWAGVDTLSLDGYTSLVSAIFDTWSFLSGPVPGRIIVVNQGNQRVYLSAAVFYMPNRVSSIQAWGYISAVKQ
jgi:hypothetical protein